MVMVESESPLGMRNRIKKVCRVTVYYYGINPRSVTWFFSLSTADAGLCEYVYRDQPETLMFDINWFSLREGVRSCFSSVVH